MVNAGGIFIETQNSSNASGKQATVLHCSLIEVKGSVFHPHLKISCCLILKLGTSAANQQTNFSLFRCSVTEDVETSVRCVEPTVSAVPGGFSLVKL